MLDEGSPRNIEKIASPKIIRNLSVGSGSSSGGSNLSSKSNKRKLKLQSYSSENNLQKQNSITPSKS
jgi:hypothetical protein